jgi:transcriptional regulator GlxA family with amidase domain
MSNMPLLALVSFVISPRTAASCLAPDARWLISSIERRGELRSDEGMSVSKSDTLHTIAKVCMAIPVPIDVLWKKPVCAVGENCVKQSVCYYAASYSFKVF